MATQSLKREFTGEEKIYVSESFVVDMEHISHLVEKDINANSRSTVSSSSFILICFSVQCLVPLYRDRN